MRTSIILFFFLVGHTSLGQISNPTKKQVFKILKASIKQDSKSKVSTNSNPWVICNEDSSYFKSDTLKLFPHLNDYPNCRCYCYIDWTFYKKDAFVLTREYIDEPRRVSVTNADNWYVIKLSKVNNDLVLKTYNQGKLVDQFNVVSIDNTIVLKRLKIDQ